jgi:aspartate/methionine/tyrosine aminotransferase
MTSLPRSTLAMQRYIERCDGLRHPQLSVRVDGLPTLPDLKKLARDRRAAGHEVLDQSAGDIDDVQKPLAEEFVRWIPQARQALLDQGHDEFRQTQGDAFGYPGNYQQQYPVVVQTLAGSWGVKKTPYQGVQTVSGRTALHLMLSGLIARAEKRNLTGKYAVILDPLAWSGYQPLAAGLGLALINASAVPSSGLTLCAEGLRNAVDFAHSKDLEPIAAIAIIPSNPTGAGMPEDQLVELAEQAASFDIPLLADAFYSPLAPEGHASCLPLSALEKRLDDKALGNFGWLVGETKVTSSQNKTSTAFWFAPEGQAETAQTVISTAKAKMAALNAYPRPQEALVAYALHTFKGGIHQAMGPRYEALSAARIAMREVCDELGLPLSIGGSFYGTAALVDGEGKSLLRDDGGNELTDPRQISEMLIRRFGLVGAPGPMFSPAKEANAMVRLTAAVTLEDVQRLKGILQKLVQEAAS